MPAVDYSATWQHVDDVLAASYRGADAGEVTAAAKVKKVALNLRDLGGGNFEVETTDQAFAMWSANMGSTVPEVGGSITIGADVWNVTHVLGYGDGSQWQVIGRKEF